MEPTHAELMALWNVCKEFVHRLEISCPEAIYQSDECWEKAPELVEGICEVVGYHRYEDEDES